MRIYIDYDSTLVDLVDGWLAWIRKQYGHKLKKIDVLSWNFLSDTFGPSVNEYWSKKGIYKNVPPIPGAQAFLRLLEELNGKENVFVVSNSHNNMEEEKEAHALKHFGVEVHRFFHYKDKWKYTSDGILVDDAPHNVIDHIKGNQLPGILFNYRNTYGWSQNVPAKPLLYKCFHYDEMLTLLDSREIKKYFPTT